VRSCPGSDVIFDATVAIIAGGRGERLGDLNKALLLNRGQPILDRQLEVLRPLFAEIIAVTHDASPFAQRGVRCVPDAIPGKGAPGGVHAAIAAVRTPWIFAVACDMPFIAADPIERLGALRSGYGAVVTKRGSRIEGLHAFYSQICLSPFEEALRAGEPSLADLTDLVRARCVPANEIAPDDPELLFLENVNTPEDVDRIGLVRPEGASRPSGVRHHRGR
jgi:molybdenum cofactor guanylyltransferase